MHIFGAAAPDAADAGSLSHCKAELERGSAIDLDIFRTGIINIVVLIVGLPYTETELFQTMTGGSPYGATRLTDDLEATPLSDEERKLCLAIGKRVATTALKLLK